MAKADQEHKSKIEDIEDAIKFLRNTTIDDPGVSLEYQEMRHKNKKEFVEKLMKKYEE
ncbi:hypothetical protein N8823_02790 [Candidatus Pseudothioglobus singularis]|nr:hypothetical protein [Candidatus Pseudothioglobus singularis]